MSSWNVVRSIFLLSSVKEGMVVDPGRWHWSSERKYGSSPGFAVVVWRPSRDIRLLFLGGEGGESDKLALLRLCRVRGVASSFR
jgi:hypothetical protein